MPSVLPYLITITLPTGNTYELRDQGARDLIQELMNFNSWLGVTTSNITDGSTTNPVIIEGDEVIAVAGDVVSRSTDHADFILSSTGVWQNFGSLSGLGALAFKNSASGTFTPQGSVAAPTFTGQSTTSTGTFTPAGSVAAPTFTGQSTTSTGKFTPEGTITGITGGTKTVKQFKTQGAMPTYTVTNHNLIITAGTLPTGEDVTVGDGSISSQGTFTGTEGNVSVTGTPLGSNSAPIFTGTEGSVSVTGTPLGSNSAPAFTGTEGSVSVTGTPLGSNSAPAFTGTQDIITVS